MLKLWSIHGQMKQRLFIRMVRKKSFVRSRTEDALWYELTNMEEAIAGNREAILYEKQRDS